MRLSRFPRWLILALSLLLLGAQQAALAHMAAHLGAASAQTVVQHGDEEHGAAQTLSHVCTTCAALDGYAAPLPALPQVAMVEVALGAAPAPTTSAPALCPARRYAARAPPLPL